jgi:hypothetical protein
VENTTVAIIATIAALVSSIMAFISWWYNKELSKAVVSLLDVKINGKREDKDKLVINFLFIFKNVGKETLKINEVCVGHIGFDGKKFEYVGEKSILNPIHPESIFNYSISFTVNIDLNIPDEKIIEILPTIIGKRAIILKLKYKGILIFSKKETEVKYFLGYMGYGSVYQLTEPLPFSPIFLNF